MIPKSFVKDAPRGYPHFPSFGIAAVPPGIRATAHLPTDFVADAHFLSGIEIAPNANIESILQVHRRKMLRRAANRRSAQQSRARKKQHLEELKSENTRLQRLVDILDSQPELVFCITATGKITYVSERTINFIKINFAAEDSDEDPTHVSQILMKESADRLLETITKLQELSAAAKGENDFSMLFSVKEVSFHDAFGRPLVGYMRCSKVLRRTSLNEMLTDAQADKLSSAGPQVKKQKKGHAEPTVPPQIDNFPSGGNNTGWNLANFKLLADTVSSLTEESPLITSMTAVPSADNNALNNKKDAAQAPAAYSRSVDGNTEKSVSNKTSEEELTTSIQAHDLETRDMRNGNRGNSPSGSNNSSGEQPMSESSSNQVKNSTSSETGSDDINGEVDSS